MLKILSFFSLERILSIVSLIGIFYLTRDVVSCQKNKVISKLDKEIIKKDEIIVSKDLVITQLQKDTSEYRQNFAISSIQIDSLQSMVQYFSKRDRALKRDLLESQESMKHAIDEGIVICDTLFIKPVDFFKKGVYKKVPKGDIREIRD